MSTPCVSPAALRSETTPTTWRFPTMAACSSPARTTTPSSVIDTKTRQVVERSPLRSPASAPEGSTPNALALDRENQMLFVANADNNDVAVVRIADRAKSEGLGFLPAGWYPSALAFEGGKLYVGNSKGMGSYSDIYGPAQPAAARSRGPRVRQEPPEGQRGNRRPEPDEDQSARLDEAGLRQHARTTTTNCVAAKRARRRQPSSRARSGAGSPIKHVLYIIKENRTYDQVLGDLGKGNGDPRLTIFGRKVTPNHHALAEQFVLLDNLYCDGEVSVDGHSWSNSAYATDFNEKLWPVTYGGHSKAGHSAAYIPAAGHMWDLAAQKGPHLPQLRRVRHARQRRHHDGRVTRRGRSARPRLPEIQTARHARHRQRRRIPRGVRSSTRRTSTIPDPDKRLPNFMRDEPAARITPPAPRPARYTPVAMVANNDYAVGMIVDRVTHSRYWPETAIFIIEDDAQDGADHVDARRTTGLRRQPLHQTPGAIDSTLYTTSSMLRTMRTAARPAADEPVRRRRESDVRILRRQARSDARSRTSSRRWMSTRRTHCAPTAPAAP